MRRGVLLQCNVDAFVLCERLTTPCHATVLRYGRAKGQRHSAQAGMDVSPYYKRRIHKPCTIMTSHRGAATGTATSRATAGEHSHLSHYIHTHARRVAQGKLYRANGIAPRLHSICTRSGALSHPRARHASGELAASKARKSRVQESRVQESGLQDATGRPSGSFP